MGNTIAAVAAAGQEATARAVGKRAPLHAADPLVVR
jgi:hypothetical protein